jgi:hypothetical protein
MELHFFAQGQRDPAVAAAVDAGWCVERARAAGLQPRLDDLRRQERRAGLHQTDLEVPAAAAGQARVQRDRQRLERIQRRQRIDDQEADAARVAGRVAVQRHHAGEGLQNRVGAGPCGVGAGRAEAVDRQVDEVRNRGRQCRVAEAELVGHAGAEALDEHVAAVRQAPRERAPGFGAHVDRDAALAAVDGEIERGVFAVARAHAADPVALGGLDLGDLRAVLAEQHAAVRPGVALARVEHAQCGEGQRHHCPFRNSGRADCPKGS